MTIRTGLQHRAGELLLFRRLQNACTHSVANTAAYSVANSIANSVANTVAFSTANSVSNTTPDFRDPDIATWVIVVIHHCQRATFH